MYTLKYHFVDPKLRESVDLRAYEIEFAKVIGSFPFVTLDKVKRDYYQITISDNRKNRIVRKLGRQLAKTSLKIYARSKKGKKKASELFREKKS